MMRAELIEDRLVRLFRDRLECQVVALDIPQWTKLGTEIHPRFRFGYMPPIAPEVPDVPRLIAFSPELIAVTTEWLDDDQVDAYLTTIESFVAEHLASPEMSSSEVMATLEDELSERSPDILRLVTEVEMRAMDAGIVAPLTS